MLSTSTNKVLSSLKLRQLRPITFLSTCFTVWTKHSQNPPNHAAFSIINFHITPLFDIYWMTSLALTIFTMFFEADLNAALNRFVNFKWTTLVEVHVNKHMYALASSAFSTLFDVYRGPAKSKPVCVKDGSSEMRSLGNLGCRGIGKWFPFIFLHGAHLLKIFFTVCCPRMIQNRSLIVVRVGTI